MVSLEETSIKHMLKKKAILPVELNYASVNIPK